MSRLWDRGQPFDEIVERFTVGRDPELDRRLVAFDALASAAHARMLQSINILSREEMEALLAELAAIVEEAQAGRFEIQTSDEDCHTAIENRLTAKLGVIGRRIHTGRSRNDQVLAALRLHGREALLDLVESLLEVTGLLLALARDNRDVSVAGYTHTRQAMPSTLGLLFAAHAEGLLDDVPWLQTAFGHINRSPLGSASGYGVPLPLDRQLVADLLRFDSVQTNTIAVQNDRGKTEFLVLGAAVNASQEVGRLASDLIWFSSEALGYVTLSDQVTTGSSIMPQKRNPDVLELIRASAARVRSRQSEIAAVYAPLSSGYHRDLQLTKEPFLEGMMTCLDIFGAIQPALKNLVVDRGRCKAGMTRAIGATDIVYQRVAAGEAFRTAYKAVAGDPAAAVGDDFAELWRSRQHAGAPGALDLEPYHHRMIQARQWLQERRGFIQPAWKILS